MVKLLHYFGNGTVAGEPPELLQGGPMNYCNFYHHCNSVGCSAPTNFQKNHDFHLDLEVPAGWRVIVGIRDPLEAIISYYEKHRDSGRMEKDFGKNTKETWQRFLDGRIRFYVGFFHRWIVSDQNTPHLILPYEHLVENTEDSLAQVIRLLVPHHKPDLDRIQRVVDAEHVIHQEMRSGVRKRRKIEDFSYWNDVYREMFDHKMVKAFGFTYREWLQKNL